MHHKFVRDKILGILYSADLKNSKIGWFQKIRENGEISDVYKK